MPGAIYYYNTPHVSMGSVHSDGAILQSRYNTILFGADPSQGLRVEVFLPDVAPNKRRYETRGRVVQHKNCMVGQGTLYEDGGASSNRVGAWNILHVSDFDTFADERAFVAALSVPEMKDQRIRPVTMDGETIVVDLTDMSISINDTPRQHPPKMLHDSPYMSSAYGSGKITIRTEAGAVTFDGNETLRPTSERPDPTIK